MLKFAQVSSAALLLAALCSSCVFAVGTDGSDGKPSTKVATSDAKPAASGGQVLVAGVPVSASDKQAALKAEKKARELTYARMELALAEMDAQREMLDASLAVENARHEVEAAQRELEHFQKVERPLEMEDQQMDIDRVVESALEQRQELDELARMYKKDDFAALTKELVLQRGKFRMEIAQREMDLAKKRAADKQEHAWVVKERDLNLALEKARQGLNSAESKLAKTQAHNELELLRARHKLEDAERPDEDEKKAEGDAKGA